jgi:hypothetical protein
MIKDKGAKLLLSDDATRHHVGVTASTSNLLRNTDDDDEEEEEVSLHLHQVMDVLSRHAGERRRWQIPNDQTPPPPPHPRAFQWHMLNYNDVSNIPDIYPTLCCPITIKDLHLNVIGERISNFMRLNSIRCEYDDDYCADNSNNNRNNNTNNNNNNNNIEQRSRALCTASCVTFVVQLWQANKAPLTTVRLGSNSNNNNYVDNYNGIVIEVRRIQGCSIGMHRIRHALVRSIQSDERSHPIRLDMTSILLRRRFVPSPRIKDPMVQSNSVQFHNNHNKGPSATNLINNNNTDDLRTMIDLLESDSFYENDLGIESLSFLSDPKKVKTEDAMEVARALIFRRGGYGGMIQNAVEDYLYDLKERSGGGGGLNTNNDILDHYKRYNHALLAMANSMSLILDEIDDDTLVRWRKHDIEDDDDSCSSSTGMLRVFWRNMMEVMVQQLGSFQESPSCAAVAARCVRLVGALVPYSSGSGDDDSNVWLDFHQLQNLLLSAHEYGKAYNAMLEEESFNLSSVVATMHQ